MSRGPLPLSLLLMVALLGLAAVASGCKGGGGGNKGRAAMDAASGSLNNKYGVGGGLSPPAIGGRVWTSRDGSTSIGVGASSDFKKDHGVGFSIKKTFGR
ncbi:hypothetical protein FJT64_004841 [Amphibalanus amphitrite]|uniref:Uncharacterized protein n=1 Tax=Amphibalanus amphitrite TaxID=1232801 RepID=A0A6A4W1U6_AMPAM|nr:hypothetical protein FJT64_004841 [Amphibalanus amphitrite]